MAEGRKLKKVSVDQVKLENPGDKIDGFLRAVTEVQMKNGIATEMLVQREDGSHASVILGVAAAKVVKLQNIGTWIEVKLKGTEKTLAGNNVNTYDIQVADD